MRVIECNITAFGQLVDLELSGLDEPVVVVYGANEAGKSTFFKYLLSMMYGFYPASEDQHSYVPRQVDRRIEGSLRYKTSDGREWTVNRRLLSSPRGTLVNGGEAELRNREIPAVSHIPLDVFESVYALHLGDLGNLTGRADQEVKNRLLGTFAMDFLRPADEVVRELEEEANALWRPDRRGAPLERRLTSRIGELRTEAAEARRMDDELRQLHDRVSEWTVASGQLRNRRIQLQTHRKAIERLAPVKALISEWQRAREAAGDPTELEGFPDEPRTLIRERSERIRHLENEIAGRVEELAKLDTDLQAVNACDELALGREQEIRRLLRSASVLADRKSRYVDACRELDVAVSVLDERRAQLLTAPWSDELHERIDGIREPELRQRLRTYRDAADLVRTRRDRAEHFHLTMQARQSAVTGIVVSAVGAALLVASIFVGQPWLTLGAVVSASGIMWTIFAYQQNSRHRRMQEVIDVESAEKAAREAAHAVAELLEDVPLPEGRLKDPDDDLLQDVLRVRDAAAACARSGSLVGDLKKEIDGIESAIREIAEECELPADGDPGITLENLERALDEANAHQRQAEAAKKRKDEVEAALVDLRRSRDEIAEQVDRHIADLRDFGGGNQDEGLQRLRTRRQAAQRAEELAERLAHDHPGWKEMVNEISTFEEEIGPLSEADERLIRLDEELQQVNEELEEVNAKIASGITRMEHLMTARSADDIASEMERLVEERAAALKRRDRLVLLAAVIRHADREFRRKHQPDVMRQAGEFLSLISGGRYDRVDAPDSGSDLYVCEAGKYERLPVAAPLSQGTRDQVFLAVRLAIVEHLDRDRERLPLILDEVLVNWDARRRRSGYEILRDISGRRQIICCTCHDWLRDEISRQLGARVVTLSLT